MNLNNEGSLHLFLNGFTARDLAEPLISFDDSTPVTAVRAVMEADRLEFVGIRRSGTVTGWLSRQDVVLDQQLQVRSLAEAAVIADTASLNEVVDGLNVAPCVLVRSLGQIGGLIARGDLQKPAMRMWLFGLVTITELRVTRMIDEFCPQESWRQYLSEGRLQKANDLQGERLVRGQQPTLLDCLQFADKGQIFARDERLRARSPFKSKREVEQFVSSLQDLRNNLAHAQEISGDWEMIRNLATNLHRIVLGPPDPSSPEA